MAKATITIEDIDVENASLEIDWHGQYNEESGAHRLAVIFTLAGAERSGPVEDIHPDDHEGSTTD